MSTGTKAANGTGSIRKKTIRKGTTTYTYFEGRVTTYAFNGKQVQRTVTAKTKAEVVQKIKELSHAVDTGTYVEPSKITVSEWLDDWQKTYLVNVKASTAYTYGRDIDKYINPTLGDIPLQKLTKPIVQRWINELLHRGLSPKFIKDIVGVFHRALEEAIEVGYISKNPAHKTKLPKRVPPKLNYLENEDIARFLAAIDGHVHERLFKVALFTGMRENEVLGLTWDCVDFTNSTIHVCKQLCRDRDIGGQYHFSTPKDEETRVIVAAPSVMQLLAEQKAFEDEKREIAGSAWQDKNMVFSNPTGGFLSYRTVYDCYKRVTRKLGLEVRFHDLRHAYAMLSLQGGDDVRTIQGNLGHATPEFTLRVYAHVNQKMKQDSAHRMEQVIQSLNSA